MNVSPIFNPSDFAPIGDLADYVPYTGATGDVNLGAHGLLCNNITDSALTITRVPFASTAGLLIDDAHLTFDVATDTLTAGGFSTTGAIQAGTKYNIGIYTVIATPTHRTNIAIGNDSLMHTSAGALYNIAIGSDAGHKITTGTQNFCIGDTSGYELTTQGLNTFIGYYAGKNSTGNNNTFISSAAGQNVGTGNSNCYIGLGAGKGSGTVGNNTGGSNVGIGTYALYSIAGAYYNVAIGLDAGYTLASGHRNVIIGKDAGYSLSTGGYNIFLGAFAGYRQTNPDGLFIVDAGIQDGNPRANTTDELTNSILYGQMAALPANQTLRINAATTISQSLGVTGLTTATGGITIGAGSTTVWPLRFTSGALLTSSPLVAGTLEFLTDDLYFTISTGVARKAFILDDGARLTSGRIPFATTNGRLVDDSEFLYSSTTGTLTLNKGQLSITGNNGSAGSAPTVVTILGGNGATGFNGSAFSFTTGNGGNDAGGEGGNGGVFDITLGNGGNGDPISGIGGDAGIFRIAGGTVGTGSSGGVMSIVEISGCITKIGTSTVNPLGFYGVTPVDQPATVADPTGGLVTDAEARTAIGAVIDRLIELGLISA